MKPRSLSDNGERFPNPVGCFDVWFANRCHEAATASTEAGIETAVEAVRRYAAAEWCLPKRLETITGIARKRWSELNRDRPAPSEPVRGKAFARGPDA